MIGDIRKNLQQHKPAEPHSIHQERARAAVLVPILADTSGVRILLTERARGLSSHGGEVAFPGGKEDRTDHSLEFTALRENEEELGIPAEDVDVIGSLRPVVSKHGLLVKPYVGIVRQGIRLRPNPDEIASLLLGRNAKGSDLDSVENIHNNIKGASDYEELVADFRDSLAKIGKKLPEHVIEGVPVWFRSLINRIK